MLTQTQIDSNATCQLDTKPSNKQTCQTAMITNEGLVGLLGLERHSTDSTLNLIEQNGPGY